MRQRASTPSARASTPASSQARSLTGTTTGQAVASVAGRWLLYVGLVLLVGAALTGWIALGGRVTEPGQWLLRGAWLLAAAGILTSMLAERAITKVPSLLPLFLTPEGAALANEGKAIVACAAAVLVVFLWPHRIQSGHRERPRGGRHARTCSPGTPTPPRRIVCSPSPTSGCTWSAWASGSAGWPRLVLGLRDEDQLERADSVRRFSAIATVALVPVLVTGLLRGMAEVGSPSQIVTTAFGATLLVKVALVLALVALGAVNHYRVVPALSRDAATFAPFAAHVAG